MDYQNESYFSNCMDLTEFNSDNECEINNICNSNLDRPPRNFGKIGDLRSVQELPKKYQCVFEFPLFNIIQSHVLDDVLYSDVPLVISAPTGSGKTAVFELAILRLLMKFEESNFKGDYKIVYVAPVKALCGERLTDWHTKFRKVGLSCIVVTGDSDFIECRNLTNYHIILTTPEKWDALTRFSKDKQNIMSDVKLFLIDEVHLLNEEARGPILEALVSRMKILQKSEQIRFVAVSATIPNIEDIAEWLGKENDPAIYFKIGEEFRPVKLKKIVLGYPCAQSCTPFKFDLSLNYKLQSIIMQYAEGKPTLIFCNTRKSVEMTSNLISKEITFHLKPDQRNAINDAAQSLIDNKMRTQLKTGVGCHHGGMTPANRNTIECLFRSGSLPVLVTTSTLAMGVNLPAHLVIIKSTQHYVNGSYQDYSETNLLQMIGRAGRPQFDVSATVVIMTKYNEKTRYEKMLGGTELIESNLHRHLTEHLNAEVVLQIITDIAVALDWLRSTFLYIRVLKNPKHYNMPANFTKDKIEKKLQDLCQIEINSLNRHGMLQIDNNDGFSLYPTNIGSLMAKYYLAFETVKVFLQVKGTETLSEMLMTISKCHEFSETYLRVNDKKTLNTLNRCKFQLTIRFPLPGNIKTTPMKVNCMIQAVLGCLRIQDPSLIQESVKIMRTGERLLKCLVEYLLKRETCFEALLSSLVLKKCFHAKLWENSEFVSKQLQKIGPVMSSMLVSSGKTTFKSLLESNPRDIERIINRAPPMGNEIQSAITHLPFYRLEVFPPAENQSLKVEISVKLLNPENVNLQCTVGLNTYMTLLVGDTENNILLCTKLRHNTMAVTTEHTQYVDVVATKNHFIRAYLISENWVGIDCQEKVEIIIEKDDQIQTNSSTLNDVNTTNIINNSKNVTKPKRKTTKTKLINENQQTTMLSYLVPTPKLPIPVNKSPITIRKVTKNSTGIHKITNISSVTNQESSTAQNNDDFIVSNIDKNIEADISQNPLHILENSLMPSEQNTQNKETSRNDSFNSLNNKNNKSYPNTPKQTQIPNSNDNMGQEKENSKITNIRPIQNVPESQEILDILPKSLLIPKHYYNQDQQKNYSNFTNTLLVQNVPENQEMSEISFLKNLDNKIKENTKILTTQIKPNISRNYPSTEDPYYTPNSVVTQNKKDLTLDKNTSFPLSFKEYIKKNILEYKKDILHNDFCDFDIGLEEFIDTTFTDPEYEPDQNLYSVPENLNLGYNHIERSTAEKSPEILSKIIYVSDSDTESDFSYLDLNKTELDRNPPKSKTITNVDIFNWDKSVSKNNNTQQPVTKKIEFPEKPFIISPNTQPNHLNSIHNETVANYYKKHKNLTMFAHNTNLGKAKMSYQDNNSSCASNFKISAVKKQPNFSKVKQDNDVFHKIMPKSYNRMLGPKNNVCLVDLTSNSPTPIKKSRFSLDSLTQDKLEECPLINNESGKNAVKSIDLKRNEENSKMHNLAPCTIPNSGRKINLSDKRDNSISSISTNLSSNYPLSNLSFNAIEKPAPLLNFNTNFNNYLVPKNQLAIPEHLSSNQAYPKKSTVTNLTSNTYEEHAISSQVNTPLELNDNISLTQYNYYMTKQNQDNVKMSLTIYEKKETSSLQNENHVKAVQYNVKYNCKSNNSNKNLSNYSVSEEVNFVLAQHQDISPTIMTNKEEKHNIICNPVISPILKYKPYFRKAL